MSTHTLQRPSNIVDQDALTLSRQQDANTKRCFDSMIDGKKLDIWLDCGRWLPLVETVEQAYESGMNGDKGRLAAECLNSLIGTDRFPGLKELLLGTETIPPAPPQPPAPQESNQINFPALPDMLLLPAWARPPEGLSREASLLMGTYIAYSKKVSPEGHDLFHEAAFLSMLSTINARRTKIDLASKDYCSLIIVFVADTTDYAKTTTVKAVEKVLEAAGLRFFLGAGKTTPQRLVFEMAGIIPKDYMELDSAIQERIKQRLAFAGQRGLHSGEFGMLIKSMMNANSAMADFQGLILEMDDNKPTYENGTMARGAEIVTNPYLSILGCATPANLSSSGKHGSEFWSDGFWPRMALICPPDGTAIDCPMELGEVPVPPALVHALQAWHHRLGVPMVTIEPIRGDKEKDTGRFKIERTELPEEMIEFGEGVYDAWVRYRSALKQLSRKLSAQGLKDLKGSYGRLPVKALRIAALLGSLENYGVVALKHFALAQEICERWRASLHELYAQINQAPDLPTQASRLGDKILEVVKKLEDKGKPPTVKEIHDYIKYVDVGKLKMAVLDFVRIGRLQEDKSSRKFPCYSIAEEADE